MKTTTSREVADQMATLTQERDGILEIEQRGETLAAQQLTRLDEIETKLSELNATHKRLLVLETSQRSINVHTGVAGNNGLSAKDSKDLSKFSLLRGIQSLILKGQLDGIEAEVNQEARSQYKASGLEIAGDFIVPTFLRGQTATGQTTAAGDQGGVGVPTELGGLVADLWEKNFLSQIGATRFSNLSGNQDFPVQISKPTAQERTEIQAADADEVLFTKISMTPNRRAAMIPISRQLILQSSFDVQSFVTEQIRFALDKKLNQDAVTAILAAITGGNGNLLAAGTNGAAPTYAHMVALETQAAANNHEGAVLKHLTNPKVRGKLKLTEQFSGTSGVPVFKDSKINDYDAVITNLIPSNLVKGSSGSTCSAHIFGDFSYLYVGMWGGVGFKVDDLTLAANDQVRIIANMYWDVEVARAAAFTGYKDFTTT